MRGYECRGCGLYFSGMTAFDKHRVGSYQPNERRCMNASEMLAAGLVLKNDVWGLPISEERREQLARLRLSAEV